MGAYLAKPKTEKISDGNDDKKLSYGVSCMQGWRVTMEVTLIEMAFISPFNFNLFSFSFLSVSNFSNAKSP